MELFYFENLLLGNGGWASWVEVNDTLGCGRYARLRPGWGLVEMWWGCKLRCWRSGKFGCGPGAVANWGVGCGGLGPGGVADWVHLPHVAGPTCHTWQLHLPHMAAPPATRGSSTCHMWQVHLPHQKGLFCHTKEDTFATKNCPPTLPPKPCPGSPNPSLPNPKTFPPTLSHNPSPTR